MERVITCIDGFNLYFGMKSQFGDKFLWLNVEQLSQELLKADQDLISTKYFTSMVTNQPDKEKRQRIYLEALQEVTKCNLYYGRYQSNVIECKGCRLMWPSPKEKMTDVNIATQMLVDAFTDKFDTAILISGDSDLVPPIQIIKSHFKNKRIGIFFPPKRHSIQLQSIVDFSGYIGKKTLLSSQMRTAITKADGYTINKPESWK